MARTQLILLVAAAVGILAAISLGNWQTRRGDDKLGLQAQADAAERAEPVDIVASPSSIEQVAAALPRRVRISGVFDPAGTIYLDNRSLNGVAGVYVLTPLVIRSDLPAVLVDRGWKARDALDRTRVDIASPATGVVRLQGLAVSRPSTLLELGGGQEHRVPGLWQNLDYAAYEQSTGRRVARFVVRQTADAGTDNAADGLRREWPRPATGVETHRGYAFQWYSLAALIALGIIGLAATRWRRR
ncbi:MAG: SURF1 family protein [Burkholderiaceae bacterium]